MKPPKNAQIMEWGGSTLWFEESGKLACSISHKNPPRTLEETRKIVGDFMEMIGGQKVCMLIDITNVSPTPKETRDLMAEELPKMVKALAIISGSPLGNMVANLFFNIKAQPYPVKMFGNEDEARKWIKQYL